MNTLKRRICRLEDERSGYPELRTAREMTDAELERIVLSGTSGESLDEILTQMNLDTGH